MLTYFDSSVVLRFLKKEEKYEEAHQMWTENKNRFSSILFEAEIRHVINRTFQTHILKLPSNWLTDKQSKLDSLLEEIYLIPLNSSVIAWLRTNPKMKNLRSLDAIHLATAQFIGQNIDEPLLFLTLDNKMKEAATVFGFMET